jgi:hypothetical protein
MSLGGLGVWMGGGVMQTWQQILESLNVASRSLIPSAVACFLKITT